jgi:hypothetical protein
MLKPTMREASSALVFALLPTCADAAPAQPAASEAKPAPDREEDVSCVPRKMAAA